MNTQTKPELEEPKNPVNVILDNEDSSTIDICVQKNSFNQRLVNVHVRYSSLDIEKQLKNVEGLESKIIDRITPYQLKRKFLILVGERKPLEDYEEIPDEYYILRYDLSAKDNLYRILKKL